MSDKNYAPVCRIYYGLCEYFPCKIFLEPRDPNISDEEFQKSLKTRKGALKRQTEIRTEKWLLGVSSS